MMGYVGSVIVCGTVVPGSTTLTTGPPSVEGGDEVTAVVCPEMFGGTVVATVVDGTVVDTVVVVGRVVAVDRVGGPLGVGHANTV